VGSQVDLALSEGVGSEVQWWTAREPTQLNFGSLPVLLHVTGVSTILSGLLADGSQTVATVTLRDGAGVVIDQGSQTFTWSSTAGLGVQAFEQAGSSSSGLSAQEHDWLDQVQQFISNTAKAGGRLGLQVLAGGILEHPDVGLMHPCDSPFLLTGEGELRRPASGIGVNAYGLVLQVALAPSGAGLVLGQIAEYSVRVAQLVANQQAVDGTTEYPVEILDLHAQIFAWIWKDAFPERILFSVTPGFEINAQWLCVTFPV
jgi:hypothetical protein